MKKMLIMTGLVLAMGVGMAFADASQPPKKQTLCPVMGGAVNTNVFTVYEGKKIYFCCGGCVAPFKKDPAKFISKMEKDGVVLEKVAPKGK